MHSASPAVAATDHFAVIEQAPCLPAVRNIAAYHFVEVDDPAALAATVLGWAETNRLLGTVLVASEGINLFLAGAPAAIERFLDALRQDPRLAAIRVKSSDCTHVPFARLKVKVKPEIIRFGAQDSAPLSRRAASVAPEDLRRWMGQGRDDAGRRVVLLDTRNREEVGYGTFSGALTLPIDNFTELPAALAPHRDALADATVVSFCTGGIRCEKAALWMQDSGMDNVLQLDGGILGYFEVVGGSGYDGRCFVFDARLALDAQLKPLHDGPVGCPRGNG